MGPLASSATKRPRTQNASSIHSQGVLASLLVRPKNQGYEIVFGAQRFRAAQIAGKESVPVEIRDMTDAQVMEAQLVELSIVVKHFLFVYAGSHVVCM
jgi:ParB/RepB/Spo0J family partition protein